MPAAADTSSRKSLLYDVSVRANNITRRNFRNHHHYQRHRWSLGRDGCPGDPFFSCMRRRMRSDLHDLPVPPPLSLNAAELPMTDVCHCTFVFLATTAVRRIRINSMATFRFVPMVRRISTSMKKSVRFVRCCSEMRNEVHLRLGSSIHHTTKLVSVSLHTRSLC